MNLPESFYNIISSNYKNIVINRDFTFESAQSKQQIRSLLHESPNSLKVYRNIEGIAETIVWLSRPGNSTLDFTNTIHLVECLPDIRKIMKPHVPVYAGVMLHGSFTLLFIQRADETLFIKVFKITSPSDLLYQVVRALQLCSLPVSWTPVYFTGEIEINSAIVAQFNRYFHNVHCIQGVRLNFLHAN